MGAPGVEESRNLTLEDRSCILKSLLKEMINSKVRKDAKLAYIKQELKGRAGDVTRDNLQLV